jgi:hypothetical protein
VNQNHGSHGRVHDAMDWQVEKLAKTGRVSRDGKISMQDAINAALASHMEAFPLSKCSRACILAQLKAFYDDLKCDVNAVDKQGNPAMGTDSFDSL